MTRRLEDLIQWNVSIMLRIKTCFFFLLNLERETVFSLGLFGVVLPLGFRKPLGWFQETVWFVPGNHLVGFRKPFGLSGAPLGWFQTSFCTTWLE